jgi:hypothetical protein
LKASGGGPVIGSGASTRPAPCHFDWVARPLVRLSELGGCGSASSDSSGERWWWRLRTVWRRHPQINIGGGGEVMIRILIYQGCASAAVVRAGW